MRTQEEGVKKRLTFADVLYGWPPTDPIDLLSLHIELQILCSWSLIIQHPLFRCCLGQDGVNTSEKCLVVSKHGHGIQLVLLPYHDILRDRIRHGGV